MTSSQIRQSFLDFFKSKQHTIVPSSSLMPDSPNLLFTNAGMNQFVPIFLGQAKCPYKPGRAADTQKCIRAGGKHNDLEDVGLDTYHHTFFEMLGNWSFGDPDAKNGIGAGYFKKEAIEWAWELVVEQWKFPPTRLYATVYKPGPGEPSEFDQEAYGHWEKLFKAAGLDPKIHVCTGGKKDNFWMMGETGPCGPCSEIHMDLTPAGDTKGALVNKGDARCIEIWNLVFIQFNSNPDGTFTPLPAKHVDTGMGFERVTSIIQGTKGLKDFANAKISNYETDIFRPIFDALEKLSGKKYGSTLPQVSGSATIPVEFGGARASSPASVGVSPTESPAQNAQYYKRRLPHFERPWAKYMVSFSTRERRQLSPQARDIVLKSLLFGHEQRRYELYAACVMPDHVHFLFEPQIKEQDKEGKPVFWPLAEILQTIKSFTAHEINKVEGTKGQVWENESFDRMIRGDADLEEKFHYVCRNPWDSGVVPVTENYAWLWTPDAGSGNATVPVALVGVPLTDSAAERGTRASRPQPSASSRAHTAARDAQQSDRDGRAPQSQEQIQIDIAFRVIADHIRTLSFAIADGIQPGIKGRNGVLRSIHKRMARYASTIDVKDELLLKTQDALVETLALTMGDVFPGVRTQKEHIKDVLRQEADVFNRTLTKGIEIFEEVCGNLMVKSTAAPPEGRKLDSLNVDLEDKSLSFSWKQTDWDKKQRKKYSVIPAEAVFKLYDTYGFPLDLTELMARERGLSVDKIGFNELMDEQKKRSQAAQKKEVISLSQIETTTPTKFVGFDKLETKAKVLEVVSLKDKTAVILDTSACYAEMGGQVGDTGELEHGSQLWRVTNTQKSGNTWLHFIETGSATVPVAASRVSRDENRQRDADDSGRDARAPQTEIALPITGSAVMLSVDRDRRNAIQRHHSVTHLLHWALHEVVSKDASQKGSFVGPDKLTFDFNSAPLTPAQVADIEKLVNERILENAPVSWTEVPYAEVKRRNDIRQFFGEKYGDTVRVLQIGGERGKLNGYSMELCGGTHVRATGEIGLFRIVSEAAIAAGVRRIEAVAGLEAYSKAAAELVLIKSLAGKVNSPPHELEKKIENLVEQQKTMEKQLKAAQQREASNAASLLLEEVKTINPASGGAGGIPAIIHNLGAVDGDFLQTVADSLKTRFKGVIVLGGVAPQPGGAVALVAAVSPDYTAKVQAGKIIQQIAPIIGGKGGGKPDNARGGGKEASKLDEALAKAKGLLG